MLIFYRSLSSLKSIISQVFGTDFSFPLCLKHIKSFKLSTNEFMKILINLSPQKQYLTVPGTLGDVSMAEQFIVVERELYYWAAWRFAFKCTISISRQIRIN